MSMVCRKDTQEYMGDSYWTAKNPAFGVEFTYFLKEDRKLHYPTPEKKRRNDKVKQFLLPGFEAMEAELREKIQRSI